MICSHLICVSRNTNFNWKRWLFCLPRMQCIYFYNCVAIHANTPGNTIIHFHVSGGSVSHLHASLKTPYLILNMLYLISSNKSELCEWHTYIFKASIYIRNLKPLNNIETFIQLNTIVKIFLFLKYIY